uniref:Uncharacterized protein n=1 Tax=Anopheles coluzzii TaxID=1518534 RepID=A0A8W7P8H4_ANOCL
MVGSEDTRSSGLSDPLALDTPGPHPFRWLPVVPPLVEAPAPPPQPPLLDEVSIVDLINTVFPHHAYLGDSTELGSFWGAEGDDLRSDTPPPSPPALFADDRPRSMLWRDLGVIIDAGKTGLGRPRRM